jgi:hypothetical protein
MITIKNAGYIALSVCIFTTTCVLAQQKKKTVVTTTTTKTGIVRDGKKDSIRVAYFPEFYRFGKVNKNDTIYDFEFVDNRGRTIRPDTLRSVDNIDEIAFTQGYYDKKDGNTGIIGHAFLISKIKIYTRIDPETWILTNMATQRRCQVQEFKKQIVRRDTTVKIIPETGDRILNIHKYYKVKESFDQPIEDDHHHAH